MAVSANSIAGAVAAVGVILLAIATPAGWAGQSAPATEALPPAPAASVVASAGVTLHSLSIDLPSSDRAFPGGARANVINNNCLACHSAGMVLNQPGLSRAAWQAEVDKMREIYKAPIAAKDVTAIVDYLGNLNRESHAAGGASEGRSRAARQSPRTMRRREGIANDTQSLLTHAA